MANEMQNTPMQKMAYHVIDGAKMMYTVDANSAVASFPEEWSFTPWAAADTSSARAAREEQRKRDFEEFKTAAEQNKALGLPPPVPPPAPLPPLPEPSDRQKAEIEADAKARVDAAERVRVQAEKDEVRRKEDEQIAADKALLATPPPQPDPTERRPFGRPGPMTPAERAAADKRAAAKAVDTTDNAARAAREEERRRFPIGVGDTAAAPVAADNDARAAAEAERRRVADAVAPTTTPRLP